MQHKSAWSAHTVLSEQSWSCIKKQFAFGSTGTNSKQHAYMQTMQMESKVSVSDGDSSLHCQAELQYFQALGAEEKKRLTSAESRKEVV